MLATGVDIGHTWHMSLAEHESDYETEELEYLALSEMEREFSDDDFSEEAENALAEASLGSASTTSVQEWATFGLAPANSGYRLGAYSENTTEQYLNYIGSHRILTKDDETRLAQSILRGKEAEAKLVVNGLIRAFGHPGLSYEEANYERRTIVQAIEDRHEFVVSNLKLVVSVAKKYIMISKFPLLDLIQEGNLGLDHAIDKFDERKGFKFSTYATWWIRQSIGRAVNTKDNIIMLPDHMASKLTKLGTVERISDGKWDEATIADFLNITLEQLEDLRLYRSIFTQSLEEAMGKEDDRELVDALPDETSEYPFDDFVDREASKQRLEAILDGLDDELHKQVLTLHFGLDGNSPLTLGQIATELGISDSLVRRISDRATLRLRRRESLEILTNHCCLDRAKEKLLVDYFGEGRSPGRNKADLVELDELCEALKKRVGRSRVRAVINEVAGEDKSIKQGLLNRFRFEKQFTGFEAMARKQGISKAMLIPRETEVLKRLAEEL